MASSPTTPTKRVFLWATPRSLSTAFLRAISNVDDFQVWYEPYLLIKRGQQPVSELPNFVNDNNNLEDPEMPVPSHLYSVFGESNTYDWVRQQLEGDFPGKRLVFVKDMVEGIHGHYDKLPSGYRHTFLIRHPVKAFMSMKKMYKIIRHHDINLDQYPESVIPPGYFYKEMVEFVEHVKQVHDPNPLIIDADDLQSNPVAVVKEYCNKVGVPFEDRIVSWQGDVTFGNWMMPREWVPMFRTDGAHKKSSSASAGFSQLTDLPPRSDLPEDVLKLADASMTYYEMLLAQKIVV